MKKKKGGYTKESRSLIQRKYTLMELNVTL